MALAESGFKVVLLEAGSQVTPYKEFKHRWPYELPFRGAGQPGFLRKYFKGATEYNYRIMLDDRENPYTTDAGKPFRWIRSRVLGGRTLHWSRASDRFSDFEFKAASRDGYGENWPIGYRDIAPYYDRVERFIGVSAAAADSASISGRRFPAAHAVELLGDDLRGRGPKNWPSRHSPAGRATHAHVEQPAALSLLRQLRERLRCRRDVQHHRVDPAACAENRQRHAALRFRCQPRADGQRESRARRSLHRALH